MNKEDPEISNLVAAINREAHGDKSISTEVSPEDGPADKNILVRLTNKDRERWKEASERVGVTMSQLIRDTVNDKVTEIIDCSHPTNMRRYYPWSEFCLKCGTRIR
jgi:predicted DNA-binding protein